MNIAMVMAALQGSDKWDVFTGPAGPFTRRVKAIKLTATTSGSTAMTVTQADGTEGASTGELGLHVLEPMAGIKEITACAEGVDEYRVYYE